MHEGRLCAYGVPRLPPEVRVSVARGDPRAGEASAERREIPVQAPPQRVLKHENCPSANSGDAPQSVSAIESGALRASSLAGADGY